jgi:hypothetical protein
MIFTRLFFASEPGSALPASKKRSGRRRSEELMWKFPTDTKPCSLRMIIEQEMKYPLPHELREGLTNTTDFLHAKSVEEQKGY